MSGVAAFAQRKANCRVDIYLVKNYIYNWDSVAKKLKPFTVTLQDLQDTAFIKNEEIVLYTYTKLRGKFPGRKRFAVKQHSFETSTSLSERIDSLHLSLFGCARQFAVVCNGEVVYGGCLNNQWSSWVPPGVFATGRDNSLLLNFWPGEGYDDPRKNATLFKCLKKSNRFKLSRRKTRD